SWPAPSASWSRPDLAPSAYAPSRPFCAIVELASTPVVDRVLSAVGFTTRAVSVATGGFLPAPFAVSATDWIGEPTGEKSTTDHRTSSYPAGVLWMEAPVALTPVQPCGRMTSSWATYGTCRSAFSVCACPFGSV